MLWFDEVAAAAVQDDVEVVAVQLYEVEAVVEQPGEQVQALV